MDAPGKTLQDQTRELHKLVVDAEAKLDQVLRGLRLLEQRLADTAPTESGSPESRAGS